jgi:beta-glucosidase
MARKRSVALVFLSSDSGEDYITVDGNEGDRYVLVQGLLSRQCKVIPDFLCRNNLTAWHGGDALVLAVAEQNNNTIVVINSVGPLILEPWIDHPNVTAVCIHICLCFFPL